MKRNKMKIKMIKIAAFAVFSMVLSLGTPQGAKAETVKGDSVRARITIAEATASEGAIETASPDAVNATSPAINTTPPAVTTPGVIDKSDDEDITEVEVDDEFSVGGVFYIVTEIKGSKIYVTLFPCNECAKAIIQAGIKTIIYEEDKYASSPSVRASKRMLNAAGVRYYEYQPSGRKIEITV